MAHPKRFEFDTEVVHAAIEPDPITGAVMTPIYQTSTYAQKGPGEHTGYEYSRTDNPTRTVLQQQLAILEKADHALTFSSGMAAIDAVLNLLHSGDHVIAGDDLYGGTYRLFTALAANRGIEFSFVDLTKAENLSEAVKPNTKIVWLETPTNPLLRIADIRKLSEIAKQKDLLCVVDNTFMSPCFQNPIALGADMVMHSMTKYINGHSDVVMGALMMNEDVKCSWIKERFPEQGLYGRLKYIQNAIGAVPAPVDCFLVLRGIKTLALRMERHEQNAMQIAKHLEAHPKIEKVIYPGLESHPGHSTAKAQMKGFGGMLTVYLKANLDDTRCFLSRLQLFGLAESLGGVESLCEHPAIMTHASIPIEIREEQGIHDNMVRLSVGIESAKDLIADLDQALAGL